MEKWWLGYTVECAARSRNSWLIRYDSFKVKPFSRDVVWRMFQRLWQVELILNEIFSISYHMSFTEFGYYFFSKILNKSFLKNVFREKMSWIFTNHQIFFGILAFWHSYILLFVNTRIEIPTQIIRARDKVFSTLGQFSADWGGAHITV